MYNADDSKLTHSIYI